MKTVRSARLIGCIGALAFTFAALALATLAVATLPGAAQQAPAQKVRLAVGTTVLNVGYPMLTLAATLGYWKE